jgi:hypothetical protein
MQILNEIKPSVIDTDTEHDTGHGISLVLITKYSVPPITNFCSSVNIVWIWYTMSLYMGFLKKNILETSDFQHFHGGTHPWSQQTS